MAKTLVFGNGNICVGLDQHGQVYDFYFPYVGLENHAGGNYVHKVGVWVEGKFCWLDDRAWEITISYYSTDTIESQISAINHDLQVRLIIKDDVYNEKNIFIREVSVENLADYHREVKLFFNQQFEIYESHRGDTVYYDPDKNVIIHYKGRRVFLINAFNRNTGKQFDDYSVGLHAIEGKQGTFVDAEDGKLEKNPIEHGLTDSVIGLTIPLQPHEAHKVDYWITVDKIMTEVYVLNEYVIQKTPPYLLQSTKDYWKVWINKQKYDFKDLSEEEIRLFENSMKLLRVHTDDTGAIIASADTDLLKYGRDTYSYVWPRDASFSSMVLSRLGFDDITKKVFEFFNDTITKEGYFMHKYRSDKSLGSSWHPWIYKGVKELPIQLDETALVIIALWEDFKYSRDVEFVEEIYNSLVLKATEFLISRIDATTGLVKPSYDLWEEQFSTSTFTSSTVYGALIAASQFAQIFGKINKSTEYFSYASKVKNGILTYLYDHDKKKFYKGLWHNVLDDSETRIIDTIDASCLYGLFKFGVLDVHDKKILEMKQAVEATLCCKTQVGGLARYENDNYFKADNAITGNPWIITTLWFAQLEIAQAKTIEELVSCHKYIAWAHSHASASGILSEQLNPFTGEQISASPLTWSHAEYITTVLDYLDKYAQLERDTKPTLNFTLPT